MVPMGPHGAHEVPARDRVEKVNNKKMCLNKQIVLLVNMCCFYKNTCFGPPWGPWAPWGPQGAGTVRVDVCSHECPGPQDPGYM